VCWSGRTDTCEKEAEELGAMIVVVRLLLRSNAVEHAWF